MWIRTSVGPNGTFYQLITKRENLRGNFCLGFALWTNDGFTQEIASFKKVKGNLVQYSISNDCGFVSDY